MSIIDSTKAHHIGTAIDNNTTTIQDVLLDISKKVYNKNALEGMNNLHGVVYRVESDPSKFYNSETSDLNNNIGVRIDQYQVLLQDKTGKSIYPTPNSFGKTPEDQILINCFTPMTIAHEGVDNPAVGDNVLCNFYNTRTLKNGVIQYKYTTKNEGNASKGTSEVLSPSAASKDSKAPPENNS